MTTWTAFVVFCKATRPRFPSGKTSVRAEGAGWLSEDNGEGCGIVMRHNEAWYGEIFITRFCLLNSSLFALLRMMT